MLCDLGLHDISRDGEGGWYGCSVAWGDMILVGMGREAGMGAVWLGGI